MSGVGAWHWSRANWFLLALPLLFAISFLVTRSVDWRVSGRTAEAVTLLDWTLSVPLLYFLCYRRKLGAKQMAVRLGALACLGIWVASQLVPSSSHQLLTHLSGPRMAGLAVLALIELRLLLLALKLAFSGGVQAEELAERSGAPPLLAKLMIIEAKFWRAVWRLIRRR
jgi:hypothetical protein